MATKLQDALSPRARKMLRRQRGKDGLVRCLDQYNIVYTEGLINVVTELYENEGATIEEIAEELKRPPMEIIVALLHQTDYELITRPFAFRKIG